VGNPSAFSPGAGGVASHDTAHGHPEAPAPDVLIAGASPSPPTRAGASASNGRRNADVVTVEALAMEVQGTRRQFGELHRLAELFSSLPSAVLAFAQQLREADASCSPRRWLFSVVGLDEFALGRSLQSTLRGKLLDRLQARPLAMARSRDASAVKVELDCTYGGLMQLVHFRNLSLSECTLRQCRASCAVQLPSPRAVLDALEVPMHMVPTALLRTFSRQNGDTVTRVLLENYVAPDGTVFYVLGRDLESRTVTVAVRQSEDIDVARGQPLHALQRRTVAAGNIINLPSHPQCRLSWHANLRSSRLEADAGLVWGRLCLVVPSTVVGGNGSDLSTFVL